MWRSLDELAQTPEFEGWLHREFPQGAYLLPLLYFLWSLKYGCAAGPNPWQATGLEWQTTSPPPKHNFKETPIVSGPPYQYVAEDDRDLRVANV